MYKRKSILSILLVVFIVLSIPLLSCDGKKNSLIVNDGEFSVHFLDVDQGDSILINFPDGKNMLIDTGDTNDAVADYIIDCVKKTDENKIDYLVLTHTDTDHIGNALRIIDAFDVEKAFVPKVDKLALFPTFSTVLDKLNNQNTQITISSYTKSLSGEGWNIYFLSPAPSGVLGSSYDDFNTAEIPTSEQTNDISPIIYLECQDKRFVFTGDASTKQEELVVANYKTHTYDFIFGKDKINLECVDVLKVGHHGANDSSGEKFLELLKPQNVVISVGDNNYGHPSTSILTRIESISNNVKFFRTDVNGTISARFDTSFALKFDCINAPKKN